MASGVPVGDWRDHVVPFPAGEVKRFRELGLWSGRTIGEEFHAMAASAGDRVAVVDPRGRLTYSELDRRSTSIAAGLLELGLAVGDRVVFQTSNRVETVEAWYGVLKAGLVPVCGLPIHGRHEIDALVKSTGARAHLIDAEARDGQVLNLALGVKARSQSVRHVVTIGGPAGAGDACIAVLADADPDLGRLEAVDASLRPDDLALLQLSGGTTAAPKAIPRLHAESWYNALATAQRYPILAEERVAHVIPIVHNAGLHSALHAAHSVGATLLVCGPDPDEFIPFLLREQVDSVLLVPGIVSWLLKREDFRELLGRLRRLSLSASAVPVELFEQLEDMGVVAVQQFGMGEGFCTGTPLDAPRSMRRDTVGYPLSKDDEFLVVDPDGHEVSEGQYGELWVRGPYTIRGYWNAAERNAEAFTPSGFYKTGDVVQWREVDGRRCVVVGGRIKDLINRGGEKINAEEVESALLRHPAVREAALVAMPDPRLGERACAYLVTESPEAMPTLADLTALLGGMGLAKYKWPERLEFIDVLPRTPIGKVEKASLRERVALQITREELADASS